MADPQPTDAHLRIAHSIEEQLMVSHFSEQQRRILDLILRLSWGCGKKTAFIPKQRDFEVVGIGEGHIKAHLDWLVDARVVFRDASNYAFNKDFDQWRVSRAFKYVPQKLTELVSLNLNVTDSQLTENVSSSLRKTEVNTYGKGKFPEPESASPKERLNKYINKNDKYIEVASGVTLDVDQTFPHEAGEIWSRVLANLRPQVSAANYRTWLEKTAGLGYHDADFIVGVNDASIAEYIHSNLRSLLEKTLIQVSGREFRICILDAEKDIS